MGVTKSIIGTAKYMDIDYYTHISITLAPFRCERLFVDLKVSELRQGAPVAY